MAAPAPSQPLLRDKGSFLIPHEKAQHQTATVLERHGHGFAAFIGAAEHAVLRLAQRHRSAH